MKITYAFNRKAAGTRDAPRIALLVAIYLAGIAGIGLEVHPAFIGLTPLNLVLSCALLLACQPRLHAGVWKFMAVAALAGYWVEVLGVATGVIFGRYAYGDVLGPKLLAVPLLIGLNWAMLTFAAGEVAGRLFPANRWARLLAGGLLPVALDVLIEPVAIRYGMWHWYGALPPWQNYLGWFVLSLALSAAYQHWIGPRTRNAAAPWLFGLQVLFFLCLQP